MIDKEKGVEKPFHFVIFGEKKIRVPDASLLEKPYSWRKIVSLYGFDRSKRTLCLEKSKSFFISPKDSPLGWCRGSPVGSRGVIFTEIMNVYSFSNTIVA